jgi:hypothetical protein
VWGAAGGLWHNGTPYGKCAVVGTGYESSTALPSGRWTLSKQWLVTCAAGDTLTAYAFAQMPSIWSLNVPYSVNMPAPSLSGPSALPTGETDMTVILVA